MLDENEDQDEAFRNQIQNPIERGAAACTFVSSPLFTDMFTIQNLSLFLFLSHTHIHTHTGATDVQKRRAISLTRGLYAAALPFILRRTKKDLASLESILPSKTEAVVWLKMIGEQKQIYLDRLRSLPWSKCSKDDDEDEIIEKDMENFNIETVESLKVDKGPLVEVLKLQQICSHPSLLSGKEEVEASLLSSGAKFSAKLDFIEALLRHLFEQSSECSRNHRVVILSRSLKFLDLVFKKFITEHTFLKSRSVRVDGSTDPAERAHVFRCFNRENSKLRVLLMTSQVGGVGVTLTGANYLVICEPAWNPSVDDQASDRVYRIGQKRPVTVLRLVTSNSVEEVIYRRQIFKTVVQEATYEFPFLFFFFDLTHLDRNNAHMRAHTHTHIHSLHRRDLVRFLSREDIFAIFRLGLEEEEEEEPETMRRLRRHVGNENVGVNSEVLRSLFRGGTIHALMNHQSCRIEDKKIMSEGEDETLVFQMKNLNLAFDDAAVEGEEEEEEKKEEEEDEEYDMQWLKRRDESVSSEPTKGTKEDDDASSSDEESFNFSDFEDCLQPGDKTSSVSTAAKTTPPRKIYKKNVIGRTPAQFKRRRNEILKSCYEEFNSCVFQSLLPSCSFHEASGNDGTCVPITWNKRMRTSAGFTYPKLLRPSMKRVARIELAPKVVDDERRLRETLLHELCHVAAWLVNGCGLQGSSTCCTLFYFCLSVRLSLSLSHTHTQHSQQALLTVHISNIGLPLQHRSIRK